MSGQNVLIMGYDGSGAINRLAPIVKKLGFNAVAVVNENCSHDYSISCDQVLGIANIFNPADACDEILNKIPGESAYGIICQSDLLTFTFVELSRRLRSSRHVPLTPILRCRLKARMRQLLEQDGDLSIPYQIASSDISEEDVHVDYPCIVKPVAGAGSQMVRKCDSYDDLKRIVSETKEHLIKEMPGIEGLKVHVDGHQFSLTDEVLLEDYVAGPEFTVDGFVYDGEVHIVLIQDMFETDDRCDFLDISFITPPIRIGCSESERMRKILKNALKLLDFDNAYFHAEMKFSEKGPRIIEINPRLSGGPIPRVFEMVSGINADQLFVDLSLNNRLSRSVSEKAAGIDQSGKYVGYYTFFAQKSGLVNRIDGIDDVKIIPGLKHLDVVVPQGQTVPNIVGKRYLAFAVFEAGSSRELVASLHRARDTLHFDII